MTAKPKIDTAMEKTARQSRPDGISMFAPLAVAALVVLGAGVDVTPEVSVGETPESVIETGVDVALVVSVGETPGFFVETVGEEVAVDTVVDTVEDETPSDEDADVPMIVPIPQGMLAPPGCVG